MCVSAEHLLNDRVPRGLLQVSSPTSPNRATAPVGEQVRGEGTGTGTSLGGCSFGHLRAEAGQCWDPPHHMLERNPPSPAGREQWLHGPLHLFIRKPHFFSQPYPGPGDLRGAGVEQRYRVIPSFPDRSLFSTTFEKHWCEFSFLFTSQDKKHLTRENN